MGIIKFIFLFILFYLLLKGLRVFFQIRKAIKNAQQSQRAHHTQEKKGPTDIIEAEYRVIDD